MYMYIYMYIYICIYIYIAKATMEVLVKRCNFLLLLPFSVFQNGSIRTYLDPKRQINTTMNSNPSTSNKSEATRVRKRYT